jgi:hypothetical protein
LPEPKRYSLRFAPNMALNGLVAPLVVVPALTRLPALTRDGAFETVGTVAHPNASVACALAIGYMAFDLGSMLVGYEASVKANGLLTFHLYVWHHLLSILFWPVAILHGSFVHFVNWFVASECSSLWLALRGAMLSLGTINTQIGLIVQLLFVITFFGSRIVVMPDLVRAFVFADWDKVPGWQAAIAKATGAGALRAQRVLGADDRALGRQGGAGREEEAGRRARGEDGLRKGGTHCRRGGAKRGSGGDYLRLY